MRNDKRSSELGRYAVLAVLLLVVGVGASVGLWLQRARAIERENQARFRQEATTIARAVEREVRLFMDVLDSIRMLHTLSTQISDEDFAEFVEKGMVYHRFVLGEFGFVQRIGHEIRDAMERLPDESGRPPIPLLELDANGKCVSARPRPEYFVLTYAHPSDSLGVPIGFDFASWRPAADAVARMEVTARPTVVSLTFRGDGWFVFSPIFYTVIDGVVFPEPGRLVGFVVGVLRPAAILERAGASSSRIAMDVHFGPLTTLSEEGFFEQIVDVGDRQWVVRCRPRIGFNASLSSQNAYGVLAGGLLLTALLVAQVVMAGFRAQQVVRLVQKRTAELQATHERLRSEMAERMRLETEIHLAAVREQQRVGRDLHDSLGQKLAGALYLCRSLERQAPSDDAQAAVRQLSDILREAIAEVRQIARGLVPVPVGQDGLRDALKRLAEETEKSFGVRCAFECLADHLPEGPVAEQFYYIAREAVHNAARHAQPRHIVIRMTSEPGEWKLAIEDDGAGMPPDAESRGGWGLRIMRYRASQIGGELVIAPRLGGGTTVICRAPRPIGEGHSGP